MTDIAFIPVVENNKMKIRGEYDTIRMPKRLMELIGVVIGDTVRVEDGSLLFVAAPFSADSKSTVASVASTKNSTSVNTLSVKPMAPNMISIGCDPEFILMDNKTGAVINADKVFRGYGPLGSDAGLAELRPSPHTCPLNVVHNIRALLEDASRKTTCIPIACSAYKGWVTGFHIHFGLPKALLLFAADKAQEFIENIILTLDYLVGIPSMLKDTTNDRRLSMGTYGKPGDYRVSENTLEYRVPGGFHLRSPELTLELLTSAYAVVEDIVGRGQLVTKYWSDMSSFFSEEHFSEVYHIPNKTRVKRALSLEDKGFAREELSRIEEIYSSIIYGYDRDEKEIKSFTTASEENKCSPFIFDNWL